jgi:hypothetical protein
MSSIYKLIKYEAAKDSPVWLQFFKQATITRHEFCLIMDELDNCRHQVRNHPGDIPVEQIAAIIYEHEVRDALRSAQIHGGRVQWQTGAISSQLTLSNSTSRKKVSNLDDIYSAQPLDIGRRQIRLLHICEPVYSNVEDRIIECSLSTVSLDDNITYDAVSYAWGRSDTNEAIFVNGTLLKVRTNLYEALLTLRKSHIVAPWLWVDALCINQADETERSHQVTLIKDIFAGAMTVHIWLGMAVTGSQELFEIVKEHAMEEYSTWLCADLKENEFDQSISEQSQNLTRGINAERLRFALKMLCECQWWRRLWTVQEVAVAHNPIVHWGEHTISFVLLQLAISDLIGERYTIINWTEICNTADISNQLPSLCQLSHFYNIMSRSVKGSYQPPVYELLLGSGFRLATLDHDRVYALLGLMNRNVGIVPDYGASVEDVYERTTISLLRSENNPDLLSLAGLRTNKRPTLPSWVLDFSKGGLKAPLDLNEQADEKDEHEKSENEKDEDREDEDREDEDMEDGHMEDEEEDEAFNFTIPQKGELLLRGRQLDRVHLCSEVGPNLLRREFIQMDRIDMEILKRTLTTWFDFARHSINGESEFWWSLLGGISTVGELNAMITIEHWLRNDVNSDVLDDVNLRYMSIICHRVSTNRCLITQGGYFGIGEETIKAGDVIVSFAGSVKLFMIREVPMQGGYRYQLIGQCSCYSKSALP